MIEKQQGTGKGTGSAHRPEPTWRQPPPRRRPKVRQNQTAAPRVTTAEVQRVVRLPALHPHWTWALILLLTAAGFSVAQIFTSYQFYVYDAEIIGNQRVSSEAIYTASNVDKTNIFWVRASQIARQVETLPGIAAAKVQVRLPNHVRIEVQERPPVLVWQTDKQTTWVSNDGAVVANLGDAPNLTLVDSDGTMTADSGRLRQNIVSAVLLVRNQYPNLTQLYYGSREGIYFRAQEGWTVYLGDGGKTAEKLTLLRAMVAQIASQPVKPKVIDLRIDGKAYLR
jgi:cell division septal protein FtsQ